MKREQVLPHVMADMAARIAKGAAEYGEPLTTFNGRDALQDAYEEALDLAVYLKQALMEREASTYPVVLCGKEKLEALSDWPGPDWSQAPEWAVAWAMDADGAAYWHAHIPGASKYEWPGLWDGQKVTEYKAPSFNCPGHWRDSLRKRPA